VLSGNAPTYIVGVRAGLHDGPSDMLTFDTGRYVALTETRDATGMISSYTIDPDGTGPAGQIVIPNRDFSEQSLRGNAVFRWEYRPGSVLYVAWTQSRLADSGFGDLQFDRDRTALFAARPDNIFLVKASWWLPR